MNCIEVIKEEKKISIVMDFAEDGNLADLIKKKELKEPEIVHIIF